MPDIDALQRNIAYTFKNQSLLMAAITHSSYAKGEGMSKSHNERLEFLGDAVLELCVSERIYTGFAHMSEGEMTRMRAAMVREATLSGIASKLGLGDQLLLSKGEEKTGGRTKPSLLADALEAVLGAIYLDGGMDAARAFVSKFFDFANTRQDDYKTMLQEHVQKQHSGKLSYHLVEESGPDHKKLFRSQVVLGGKFVGEGEGVSKKDAEQNAAKQALENIIKQG